MAAEVKYQLPEDLGGDECVLLPGTVTLQDLPAVKVKTDGGRYLIVQTFDLTPIPVKPKLPEEPPVNSVVVVSGEGGRLRLVFTRGYTGWMLAGEDRWFTWAEVCKFGTPTLLVPDPLAGAPELPFINGGVEVTTAGPGGLALLKVRGDNGTFVSRYIDRTAGLAILAACDRTDRTQS